MFVLLTAALMGGMVSSAVLAQHGVAVALLGAPLGGSAFALAGAAALFAVRSRADAAVERLPQSDAAWC